MIRAVFVSDLHLKSIEERNSQTLLRFFRSLLANEQRPTHLFLVGDVFDLWIGAHDYFVDRFAPIVAVMRDLVRAGVEVHFFEGNHDLYLREFWQGNVGVRVHEEGAHFDLGGYRVRVEHGDLINPEDRGYLFLRGFLRTTGMKWLARHLPSSAVRAIGERASHASREYTSTAKGLPDEEMRTLIRRHARAEYERHPFDLIVTGHVHVRDDHAWNEKGREVRSINLGSWFDTPCALHLAVAPVALRFEFLNERIIE